MLGDVDRPIGEVSWHDDQGVVRRSEVLLGAEPSLLFPSDTEHQSSFFGKVSVIVQTNGIAEVVNATKAIDDNFSKISIVRDIYKLHGIALCAARHAGATSGHTVIKLSTYTSVCGVRRGRSVHCSSGVLSHVQEPFTQCANE
jgi:hypothetical protein